MQQDQRQARIVPLVLAQPGVRAVELWNSGSATIRPVAQPAHAVTDERAALFGIPPASQMYQPNVRAGRWLQPDDGNMLTIHEELAARVGVGVGDWVTLRHPGGKEETWQIVGLFFDSARDSGVYLPQSRYAWALNRVNRGNTLFIQTVDPSATGAMNVARMVRPRYTIVVGLLSMMAVVIAIVGSVGLSGALSLSVLECTREIGVMRAIGASSTRISLMFIGEGLIQGLLSWLIAVPLGIPAAYLLTTVVLSPLFGDTLLYQFQPTGSCSGW